jgi:hypothetical protein
MWLRLRRAVTFASFCLISPLSISCSISLDSSVHQLLV